MRFAHVIENYKGEYEIHYAQLHNAKVRLNLRYDDPTNIAIDNALDILEHIRLQFRDYDD